MNIRRNLLANAWLQLGLVTLIVVLANTWSAQSFVRADLTEDKLYSLDLATRALMTRLERPMTAKVYFTEELQAPYNNHQQNLVDKLEELRAYSKGLLDIQVNDPTGNKELEAEATRFGIQPIQYRYRSTNLTEMKQVHMGLALVYGDRQEVLPAVTQLGTLEYDLARAIKALITESEPATFGWTTGHGEPDLFTTSGPLARIREGLAQDHRVLPVALGGEGLVDEDIDALFLVGPQQPLDKRSLYQVDQFLMRGGALAVFPSNTRPDLKRLRPQSVVHGLDAWLAHTGVTLNRDLVVDRTRNGVMPVPVRQGRYVVQVRVNHPLIPKATELDRESVVVKDLEGMLFPFASSLALADPLPPDVESRVLAASHETASRLRGVRTIDPKAFKVVAPGEEVGSWPMLVSLTGTWPSFFETIPPPPGGGEAEDPATRLRQSAPTRLVVSGSADFVANNIPFILNLADWMVEDDSLISIRSKVVQLPTLDPVTPEQVRVLKLVNVAGGSLLLLLYGLARMFHRRRSAFRTLPPTSQEGAEEAT